MKGLQISGLRCSVDGNEILKGIDLTVETGKVHALMGPNGSGKSTLAFSLSGHPKYEVTSGTATLDGENLLELPADKRARAGLFLSFQYPAAIPGVKVPNFLFAARQAVRPGAPAREDGRRRHGRLVSRPLPQRRLFRR
jgi:Fe-S cluster assembly ATP-binding protein